MSNSLYSEFFFIGGMFILTLILATVATVVFVRQYRIEQRDKLAAKKLKDERKAREQAQKAEEN